MSVDEENHTYSLITDYDINDKIYKASEMAMALRRDRLATRIFGPKDSTFLQESGRTRSSDSPRSPVGFEEPIDMESWRRSAGRGRHVKQKEGYHLLLRIRGISTRSSRTRSSITRGSWWRHRGPALRHREEVVLDYHRAESADGPRLQLDPGKDPVSSTKHGRSGSTTRSRTA